MRYTYNPYLWQQKAILLLVIFHNLRHSGRTISEEGEVFHHLIQLHATYTSQIFVDSLAQGGETLSTDIVLHERSLHISLTFRYFVSKFRRKILKNDWQIRKI